MDSIGIIYGEEMGKIITIDGPAAAGKTTAAQRLSAKFNMRCVNTGSLYRALAAEYIRITGRSKFEILDDGYWINDAEPYTIQSGLYYSFTWKSHKKENTPKYNDISMLASAISQAEYVREFALPIQRRMAKSSLYDGVSIIFDGRDMGTVVFPHANLKFYLTADINIRAIRRFSEKSDKKSSLSDVTSDLKKRDKNDITRILSPLQPASDAIIIDSTNLDIDQMVERMASYI